MKPLSLLVQLRLIMAVLIIFSMIFVFSWWYVAEPFRKTVRGSTSAPVDLKKYTSSKKYDLSSHFVPINEEGSVYVYSAFWDFETGYVRIFLLQQSDKNPPLKAFFKYKSKESKKKVKTKWVEPSLCARAESIYHGLTNIPREFICSAVCFAFPDYNESVASLNEVYISVTTAANQNADDRGYLATLLINQGLMNRSIVPTKKHKFGVCLAPWFSVAQYSATQIMEYIELHRLLGAGILVFYITEMIPDEIRILFDSYMENPPIVNGVPMEIIVQPWILPATEKVKTVWYYAQILSNNDCLYRLSPRVEFILYTDLDEILIPVPKSPYDSAKLQNWLVIYERMNNGPGALCFPAKFFPTPVSAVKETSIYARHLSTVRIYPERKKCLIKSGHIFEMAFHFTRYPSLGSIAQDLAIIHHYRDCVLHWSQRCPNDTHYIENMDLLPYRNAIKSKMMTRQQLLNTSVNLLPNH